MEYVSSERKLLPYGMMNFADIRLDNYYYVDKTSFIPVIRTIGQILLFHPPAPVRQEPYAEHVATLL